MLHFARFPRPLRRERALASQHVTVLADLPLLASGKVREIYDLGDTLLLVASDRISTYDVVHPTPIPDKGAVLTGLSTFWFERTNDLVANHLISVADGVPEEARGRGMVVRKLTMLPVECVVRGYITGSGWKDYLATGSVCGHRLAEGLRESERLPAPIFTPSTKAQTGHDENITREQAAELIGGERFDEVEGIALELYRFAAAHAEARGIILADTKFELGVDEAGRLVLADEAFTPDSSRFWPADSYEPGGSQPSFDKQFARDYCESVGWDKTYPGPELPDDVVAETRAKYVEAFERLTGIAFDEYVADPEVVLR
jgi:phosphoribosylaminoimidazole-succinocarboxamide synthase